jgi:hypothetical protein
MNRIAFGTATSERLVIGSNASKPDKLLDTAWIVLEAANDLGDEATVEICRRVIDANLNGTLAAPSDLHIIVDYFR